MSYTKGVGSDVYIFLAQADSLSLLDDCVNKFIVIHSVQIDVRISILNLLSGYVAL